MDAADGARQHGKAHVSSLRQWDRGQAGPPVSAFTLLHLTQHFTRLSKSQRTDPSFQVTIAFISCWQTVASRDHRGLSLATLGHPSLT
jgi:hypothetical protein